MLGSLCRGITEEATLEHNILVSQPGAFRRGLPRGSAAPHWEQERGSFTVSCKVCSESWVAFGVGQGVP